MALGEVVHEGSFFSGPVTLDPLAEFLHHSIYLPGAYPLWIEEGLGVVKDEDHFPRGQE